MDNYHSSSSRAGSVSHLGSKFCSQFVSTEVFNKGAREKEMHFSLASDLFFFKQEFVVSKLGFTKETCNDS